MGDVRDDLRTIVNQRVQVRTLLCRLSLTGQHHRTHLQWLRLQVRHANVSFERSHASGLILAHNKFQVIVAA